MHRYTSWSSPWDYKMHYALRPAKSIADCAEIRSCSRSSHSFCSRDGKMGQTALVDPHNLQFLVGWVDIFNPSKNFNQHNSPHLIHWLKQGRAGLARESNFFYFHLFFLTQYTQYLSFFVDIYVTLVDSIFFFGTMLLIIFMLYGLCGCLVDYEFYILLWT